ncbi:cysteine-rich CWC family protein [Acidovorax sp. D2M1]|uniref:Cysteine-rich CWC family protein n=1 Tax=Acidovorax benzenivorans TaxID=2987520 RepID=A0ABT5RYH8_9BURK|nr:cysteine-rich CWC family protein [Acidovorax benzenivorans]MDD2178739.1 cysteine-rich CWC family protein [Acidovorax benzenivorans]
MPAASTHPLASSCCPLCGQPNQCAIAAGRPAESCWCMTQAIDPAALAALPDEARGQVCICAACGAPTPDAQQPSAACSPPSPI